MKKLLTENIGIKVLSLLVAVIVWGIIINVSNPQVTKTIYTVPVQLLNTDNISNSDQVYEVLEGSNVDVRISCPRDLYNVITRDDFSAYADFSELYNDLVPIRITCNKNNVNMLSQSFNYVRVSLDDVMTMSFPVKIDREGTIPEGFEIANISASPSYIQVVGAKTKLEQIASVRCALNVSRIDDSNAMRVEIEPELVDESGNRISKTGLELSSDRVYITADILNTKYVPINIEPSGTPANGFVVTGIAFDPKEIEIVGSEDRLADVSVINAEVDVTGANQDVTKVIDLSLNVPEGIKLVNASDADISVNVTLEEKISRDYTLMIADQVVFEGLGEDLEYSYGNVTTLTVTLYGLKDDLDVIATSDLHPTVDLTDLAEGTYTLDVAIQKPESDVEVQTQPKLEITIYSTLEPDSTTEGTTGE
ncbi:MAG: hypothetical protein IJ744_04390 [Lachnospiraceae bacterium]|nr:hypothetical protein [Lachnospiraceae bacterium]